MNLPDVFMMLLPLIVLIIAIRMPADEEDV